MRSWAGQEHIVGLVLREARRPISRRDRDKITLPGSLQLAPPITEGWTLSLTVLWRLAVATSSALHDLTCFWPLHHCKSGLSGCIPKPSLQAELWQ